MEGELLTYTITITELSLYKFATYLLLLILAIIIFFYVISN